MAWTAPMTAVANEIWTAAQFNTNVRDNLNESETAKVTAAGQYLVSTAANTLAARTPTAARVETSETTTSTSFADLATAGPAVTVTTGTQALVHISAALENNTTDAFTIMSFAVSGATTLGASDVRSLIQDGVTGVGNVWRCGATIFLTGLTSGSNTFTCKYRVQSGTATIFAREIIVLPL